MRKRFEVIRDRLADYEASTIDKTISQNDGMYDGNLEQYLKVGLSAIHTVSHAMMLTGLMNCYNVLDMPCGYGRVLRHLVKFFPESNIVACDLDKESVDFCKKTFNVDGVYSKKRFQDIRFDLAFDLIWCGSLLTHLNEEGCKEAVKLFVRCLSDGGVAIITLHGRFALTVQERYCKMLPDELFSEVKQGFLNRGFGYREYDGYESNGEDSYGISLTSPSCIMSIVEKIQEIQICCYSEREWASFHDVLMIAKKPISQGF